MTILEIEDTKGNTLMYLEIKNLKVEDIIKLNNCSLSDVDYNYLTNDNQKLIRIQQE